jgi:hypothetical protein
MERPKLTFVNLTPHPIDLVFPDGSRGRIPASGEVVRVATERHRLFDVEVCGKLFPVHQVCFGELRGLPPQLPRTYYLVSKLAAEAAAHLNRRDVLMVDQVQKDGDDKIGATSFAIYVKEPPHGRP